MNKIVITLLILLLPIITQAEDPAKKAESENAFDASEWMTFYYQNPEPEKTFDAIKELYAKGTLTETSTQHTSIAFLATIFEKNSDIAEKAAEKCAFMSQDGRWVIANSLWFADTKSSKSQLKKMEKSNKFLRPFLNSSPYDVLKSKELHESTIDMCWGYFLASGDTKYVRKVVSVLQIENKGDSAKDVIGDLARRSLTSNCRQHPKILKYCRSIVDDLPDRSKAEVQAILDKIDD